MSDGADQVASLRLRILDEGSTALLKMSAELRKLEDQSRSSTRGVATGFGSIAEKLQQLERIGVPGMGRLGSAFETADEAQLSFLGKTGLWIAGGAAIAGVAAAIGSKLVAAASEGEQAEWRLTSALKATGQYSDESAGSIIAWAEALLSAKGTSDELSVSLVGQGVTMGLTVEQAQRFVSAAADMAPTMGSVNAAFDALARAAQGDERALISLTKSFGKADFAGKSFEECLALFEKKTSGTAAAQVETFAGAWGVFRGEVENFMERAGTPLMKWLAQQPSQIRAAGDEWSKFFGYFKNDQAMQATWELLNGPRAALQANTNLFGGLAYDGKDTTRDMDAAKPKFYEAGPTPYGKEWFEQAKKARETVGKFEAEAAKAAEELAKSAGLAEKERIADVLRYWAVMKEAGEAQQAEEDAQVARTQLAMDAEVEAERFAAQSRKEIVRANLEQKKSLHEIAVAAMGKNYDALKATLKSTLDAMGASWDRYADKIKSVQEMQNSIGERLFERGLNMTDRRGGGVYDEDEKTALKMLHYQTLYQNALKATGDEQLRQLDAALRYREGITGEVTGRAIRSLEKSGVDTSGLSKMTSEQLQQDTIATMQQVRGELETYKTALVRARDEDASASAKMVQDIASQMIEVGTSAAKVKAMIEEIRVALAGDEKSRQLIIETLEAEAKTKALSDQLKTDFPASGVKSSIELDTTMAVRRLNYLLGVTDNLIDAWKNAGLLTGDPYAASDGKPQRKHSGYWPSGATGGEYFAILRRDEVVTPPEKFREHGARMLGGGTSQNITFNVTVTGQTAKEIDAELADLWSRKSSRLRRVVAA